MARTLIYNRPWLYPKQEAAIFCAERFGVVEASTKAGKTVACMVWLLEQAMMGKAGQNFWWVAPILEQARDPFDRMRQGLIREVYEANESRPTITLANGAVIWFKGCDHPDSLYGRDVYAAVIDEASRCKEGSWHAVLTTLTATEGPIRIIGNVKGRKNWAYHLARQAESGEPGMHYAKLICHDAIEAGVLSSSSVETARKKLPEAVFRELYLAEPSDDTGNPFGITAIRACIAPLSDKPPVVWGWDLAKSTDWCVGVALDATGCVCQLERFQAPWEVTTDTIVRVTGSVLALIDSTGVGDPVLEALQKRGRAASARFIGFKFSASSKQQLMEGLAVAIQQHQIRFPAGVLQDELEAFEYEYHRTGVSYSAPSGLHDDAVCALALAVQQWQQIGRYSMQLWGGDDAVPKTLAEMQQVADEQMVIAAQVVDEAVMSGSDVWFGRR